VGIIVEAARGLAGLVAGGADLRTAGALALELTVAAGIVLGTGGVLLIEDDVRFPQPGKLRLQPVDNIKRSINIAEKMERLLKVSRNGSFLVSVCLSSVSQFRFSPPESQ